MSFRYAVIALILVSFHLDAPAQDAPALAVPEKGEVTTVQCAHDATQSYACYVPTSYDPEVPTRILYCFSPRARGDVFVDLYKDICEKEGWIVVGSLNSRNGPAGVIFRAMHTMWDDTHNRFNLLPRGHYGTGFSGGARAAFYMSIWRPVKFSGIIAIGAGVNEDGKLPKKHVAVFVTCGDTDFNREAEIDPWLIPALKHNGNPVTYKNFPGGHQMPPKEILEEAVSWMASLANPVPPKPKTPASAPSS